MTDYHADSTSEVSNSDGILTDLRRFAGLVVENSVAYERLQKRAAALERRSGELDDRVAELERERESFEESAMKGSGLSRRVASTEERIEAIENLTRFPSLTEKRIDALEARLRGLDAERSRLSDALIEAGGVLADAGRVIGPGGDA